MTQRIAAVAYAAGIPCHGGTAIESPIATSAAAHLYCSLPAVTYGSELFGPLLMAEDPSPGDPGAVTREHLAA